MLKPDSVKLGGTFVVATIRDARTHRGPVRIGAPDPTPTRYAGMIAVTELVERLGVIKEIDAAVGPIKQRARGFRLGEVLLGMATAQLAGQDFLVGLDRVRADEAGRKLVPVPGLATSTACGLARRVRPEQWTALECGIAAVHQRMLDLLPATRRDVLCQTVTIDIDATDVEVYGRQKRGVAYTYQGQRAGRPDVAIWAQTETVLAADLLAGDQDPRSSVVTDEGREGDRQGRRGLVGQRAQGQFVLVHVTVENIGTEPQTLLDSEQKLRETQGREVSTDTAAALVVEDNDVFLWRGGLESPEQLTRHGEVGHEGREVRLALPRSQDRRRVHGGQRHGCRLD